MSDYSRPRITWGNDFTIRIALQQFLNGEYVDFNLSTVKSLEVYLICSTHNQKIPLEWELEPGFDYVISCFVDYRVTHPNTSYGIGVEGIDENDNHFRWYMAGKEGILVVTNTSGQNIPQDVEIVDLSGRVGWGIQTNGDLTNYYTKDETEQYVQGELADYYDKGETDGLLNNKVDTSTLVNDYYNKNTVDNLLDTKADTSDLNNYYDKTQTDTLLNQKANASDLNNYYNKTQTDTLLNQKADASDLNNYYDKGETDGLLNNKVDTSTLVSDYYNKNTVNNLLDAKADTSDLNNYYNKTQTDNLLNQKADTSDLNNKQDTLVSGTNIKTINNQSLLGSGNIDIQSGGTQVQANWNETDNTDPSYIQNKPDLSIYAQSSNLATVATSGSYNDLTNTPNLATVATSGDYDDLTNKPNLSQYATQTDLAGKQDTLVSGTNIKTINNQSLLGSGNIDIQGGGGENHDNADEATANALYELNERLSEAEVYIDIIPTEVQAKIDELEANVEQSLDELPPKFDEIDEEFKSTALVIEELHENTPTAVQSNWNETDTTSLAYIQNKPTIPTIIEDFVVETFYDKTNNRLYLNLYTCAADGTVYQPNKLAAFNNMYTNVGTNKHLYYNVYVNDTWINTSIFNGFVTRSGRDHYIQLPYTTTISGTTYTINNGDSLRFDITNTSDASYTAINQISVDIPSITTGMVTSTTNGLKIEVVSALPQNPSNDTIYVIQ